MLPVGWPAITLEARAATAAVSLLLRPDPTPTLAQLLLLLRLPPPLVRHQYTCPGTLTLLKVRERRGTDQTCFLLAFSPTGQGLPGFHLCYTSLVEIIWVTKEGWMRWDRGEKSPEVTEQIQHHPVRTRGHKAQ